MDNGSVRSHPTHPWYFCVSKCIKWNEPTHANYIIDTDAAFSLQVGCYLSIVMCLTVLVLTSLSRKLRRHPTVYTQLRWCVPRRRARGTREHALVPDRRPLALPPASAARLTS